EVVNRESRVGEIVAGEVADHRLGERAARLHDAAVKDQVQIKKRPQRSLVSEPNRHHSRQQKRDLGDDRAPSQAIRNPGDGERSYESSALQYGKKQSAYGRGDVEALHEEGHEIGKVDAGAPARGADHQNERSEK